MTREEKLDKAIDSLEYFINAYAWTSDEAESLGYALELLKEPTIQPDAPRVMTPQDFDGNPMKDQYGNLPCWLESRDPLVASNWCRWNEDDFIRPIMMLNFRPWTSRPTEEQRKAVKWE